jgi:hypothetical protein
MQNWPQCAPIDSERKLGLDNVKKGSTSALMGWGLLKDERQVQVEDGYWTSPTMRSNRETLFLHQAIKSLQGLQHFRSYGAFF